MKEMRLTFTDAEHRRLVKARTLLYPAGISWHDFILRKCTIVEIKKK